MKARVLKGSKKEIAESVARIDGEVREVIVFVEEPSDNGHAPGRNGSTDIFAEMEPYTVERTGVDDSRESIYDRRVGE